LRRLCPTRRSVSGVRSRRARHRMREGTRCAARPV